jgi:hypothetical protein
MSKVQQLEAPLSNQIRATAQHFPKCLFVKSAKLVETGSLKGGGEIIYSRSNNFLKAVLPKLPSDK